MLLFFPFEHFFFLTCFFCALHKGANQAPMATVVSVRGGEPLLRTRGMIGSRSVCGKAPMRQLHGNPMAVSGSGHSGKQINSFDAVIHMQEKSASNAFLSRMQLTLHETRRTPHGASRLVLAMSAWSLKTRRAPSRHCKDARV